MAVTAAIHRDVRYGESAALGIPELVAGLAARRVLLVCGRRSFEASGAGRMLPELERVAAVRRWSEFAANPDAGDLATGLRIVDEFRPDLVLGVGGGSAMDMAKLLCGFAGQIDPSGLPALIRSGAPVTSRRQSLVLVPTTSGSGSEATHFAVVYIGDEKFSVAGPALRPDTVVLDPTLTASGSAYQRATSGIDAVCQAIESLWAVGATGTSRRWARWALALLLPAIEEYVAEPTPASARAMAIGSHLAGRAIDISKTTAAHALSYGITKRYGVSHGHAVALTLGAFIDLHGDPERAPLRPGLDRRTHAEAMAAVRAAIGVAEPARAGERFRGLCERIGLATRFADLGIDREGAAGLASSVNAERLGNNPVPLTGGQLRSLLLSLHAGPAR